MFGDIHLHGGPEHNLVSLPGPSHLLPPRGLLVLVSSPLSHVTEQVDHSVQSSQPKNTFNHTAYIIIKTSLYE